jgi:hypothetical protein
MTQSKVIPELGMTLAEFCEKEIAIINKVFEERRVNAGCDIRHSMRVRHAFCSYEVLRGTGVAPKAIEGEIGIIEERIVGNRRKLGIPHPMESRQGADPTTVTLAKNPQSIVVASPYPTKLDWRQSIDFVKSLSPYQSLVGVSYRDMYSGTRSPEIIDMSKGYERQVMIGAMSGAGKSTLMAMALWSMAMTTPPDELIVRILDMKNDDIADFSEIPHVDRVATDDNQACALIDEWEAELRARISRSAKGPLMLLAFDEVAAMREYTQQNEKLKAVLDMGRSNLMCTLAGTQRPTRSEIGVIAQHFQVRIVGMVQDASSAHVVSGKAGTGADKLNLPGSFIRSVGADSYPFFTYYIDAEGRKEMVDMLKKRWSGRHRTYTPAVIEKRADPNPKRSGVPPAMLKLIKEHIDLSGSEPKMKMGFVARAVELMAGKRITGGPRYQELQTKARMYVDMYIAEVSESKQERK